MRFRFILSLVILVFLLEGFSRQSESTEPPSFYREVYPIIFAKCNGVECHGADSRASVRYTSYRSVYANRKKIIKRINDDREPMPPKDQTALSQEEKTILELWIRSGALEN
jgi:uncharacterized membrane protein